ncbi:MAG: hypothetical protein WCB33_17555, partial [Bradyrhizobium sp.]
MKQGRSTSFAQAVQWNWSRHRRPRAIHAEYGNPTDLAVAEKKVLRCNLSSTGELRGSQCLAKDIEVDRSAERVAAGLSRLTRLEVSIVGVIEIEDDRSQVVIGID